MHILIVGSYAPSLVNFRGPLIRDIVSKGHRVSVVAPDIEWKTRSCLEGMGADVHQVPLDRNGMGVISDLEYFFSLRRLIRDLSPDVVLTYTIKPNIWGAFASAQLGVPSVAMVTGLGFAFIGSGGGVKSRISRWLARLLYRFSTNFNHRLVFQNPDDKADFLAAGCLKDPAKATIVDGSGVDLEHYIRAEAVFEPVFLMISRLLRSKGLLEYFDAARVVKRQYPGTRFLLVGPHDGGPDAVGPAEVESCIAEGVIEWLGPLDDVRPVIAQSAVYVLPSYREGTPRSVLEAMAMGRPIITSDAPGCRETIRDGEEGFLVPIRNPSALASAMIRFIEHPELCESMGNKAFRRASEKYAVSRVNRQMMSILGITGLHD